MISLKIDARKFTLFLVIVLGVLLVLNVIFILLRHQFMPESGFVGQLDRYFNFATEVNLPTFFNTILIFMCGQTFYVMAVKTVSNNSFRFYWFFLSFVFFFLCMDEYMQIHEWFSSGLPRKFGVGGTGIFKFAWIIPYGVFVLIFGFYSLKVLRSLERAQLTGYITAGGLYLMGVLGMEAWGGKFVEMNNNVETMSYYLFFTTVEESLEMIGMILLLNINLKFLTAHGQ